jgi:N-hydroxyarylamine O-acetyltransferase
MDWLDSYFARIDYHGTPTVSLETLSEIHHAHVFHIPFENLDIHNGRGIRIDPDSIKEKLIAQRRGGYCYETNGLLALALEAIGFKLDRLLGRILYNTTALRPRTHQCMRVYLGDRSYLCDVGYGARQLLSPLLLEDGCMEAQFTDCFRLLRQESGEYHLQGELSDGWHSFYAFTLEPFLPIDYTLANYWNSTFPGSNFVQHRMCILPTPTGRYVMNNRVLKITERGTLTEIQAVDHAHYLNLLHQYFGIALSPLEISFPA